MKTDHVNCPIRPRVTLDDPDEPLEMIGFTIARYKFACKWLRERDRVLEAGCGEGFGCNFFSRHVTQATGLDIDEKLVARCRERYARENLRFVIDDIVHPHRPPAGEYDAVVSFEMIEHISQADGRLMLANVSKHLRDRGLAILSTPRARADRSVSRQAHHVFEYDYDTLVRTLGDYFERVMIFCQNDEYIYAGHPSTAWNFVAVCFK
jgi:cyclopropane fatty-acyl-phospholipid synthase-like methyltransferase